MSLSCYLFTMKGDHSIAAKVDVCVSLAGKNVLKLLKNLDRDSVATPEFWGEDLGLFNIEVNNPFQLFFFLIRLVLWFQLKLKSKKHNPNPAI